METADLRVFEAVARLGGMNRAAAELHTVQSNVTGHLLQDARRADGQPRGPLAVGSLETTAALRLSPVLVSYVAAHPEVDVVLTTGTTATTPPAATRSASGCSPRPSPSAARWPSPRGRR